MSQRYSSVRSNITDLSNGQSRKLGKLFGTSKTDIPRNRDSYVDLENNKIEMFQSSMEYGQHKLGATDDVRNLIEAAKSNRIDDGANHASR